MKTTDETPEVEIDICGICGNDKELDGDEEYRCLNEADMYESFVCSDCCNNGALQEFLDKNEA